MSNSEKLEFVDKIINYGPWLNPKEVKEALDDFPHGVYDAVFDLVTYLEEEVEACGGH